MHKMFGHHFDAYAFGAGVDRFPEWIKRQDNGAMWRGIKRLVGNRYLRNIHVCVSVCLRVSMCTYACFNVRAFFMHACSVSLYMFICIHVCLALN